MENLNVQMLVPEDEYAEQIEFLRRWDDGPKPPGWQLTPQAVVAFICGAAGLRLAGNTRMDIPPKFIGDKALVERCVVTLAGARGLLLVGEPGTAKSMLSELLAAAISGTSALTVQGSAGTTEDQLRYGWNYGLLLAEGPSINALVPSPVLTAMTSGKVARIEEITRCQPEIQDSLVPVLSERRIAIPELGDYSVAAREGFCVIATANLRDRGVSEMSAALKRRFNFEHIDPIADKAAEIALVKSRTQRAIADAHAIVDVDDLVVETLVTIFKDLRTGITSEGWSVAQPSTVMSTAEAVAISTSISLASAYFPDSGTQLGLIPGHILGAVRKDDEKDSERIVAYFDKAVQRRAKANPNSPWSTIWEHRDDIS
ncbi:MoxR-like ATPase [Corynebacterium mustelae]|uniref:MoxR-like ATPase n=1 Tax=Corynebacterium mustelae TaxID=571915 RepID=A0A0G3H5M0_9CORY|nr:AAA family ATPase [Corynebacterium mustelae]AKK06457.1 MoxR-like ATPase [Corynebacterium mustelae]